MPVLLVPGLFPAGGWVGRGSGAAQNWRWGILPTCPSAVREPSPGRVVGPPEPCAELSAGPRSGAPTWPAKGQKRALLQACRLAPWVPKMSSSTGLQGAPGPEPEVTAA